MGAVQSRRGGGPAKCEKLKVGGQQLAASKGYFILSFKGDKIKVVNAEAGELSLLSTIIRRHGRIQSEGWERHMTWCYHCQPTGRHTRIQIVANVLLTLFQQGWEPMTPLDMGLQMKESSKSGPQVTICFKQKEEGSGETQVTENTCLCLETYGSNYLGFHNISNTTLHEIITSIQADWPAGLLGVSNGVSSVISDYIVSMPTILPSDPSLLNEKFIQLQGDPWTSEDVKQTQRLQMCLIACLIKEGYKLCMDVNIDTTSRVFFFIKNTEDTFGEVLVPDMAGISIGRNNRPVVLRSKSSFFRTYKGKGRTNSLKKRLRNSMRRKELPSPPAGQPGQPSGQPTLGQPALRYKPRLAEPAWWQQTSTDMSSDQEGEE